MKKILKSMTDFVLKTYENIEDNSISEAMMFEHAKFLSQKIELWMFVPCDENGNVLDDKEWKRFEGNIKDFNIVSEKFKKAKERVIFEGFKLVGYGEWSDSEILEIENNNGIYLIYVKEDETFLIEEEIIINTIEDLVPYKLILK